MLKPTECTTTEGIRALVRAGDDLLRVRGWGRGRSRWWHSRVHGVCQMASAQHRRRVRGLRRGQCESEAAYICTSAEVSVEKDPCLR